MKTFIEFLQNKPQLTSSQSLLLQTDLKKGALSNSDMHDILKMMDNKWRFEDALSVAKDQANKRKYLQSIQKPQP